MANEIIHHRTIVDIIIVEDIASRRRGRNQETTRKQGQRLVILRPSPKGTHEKENEEARSQKIRCQQRSEIARGRFVQHRTQQQQQ